MKKHLFSLFIPLFIVVFAGGNLLNASNTQDLRIFTVKNADGKITGATIEKAFEKSGFLIDGNNDMNKPFKARFGATHFPVYRLATVHDPDLSAKLVEVNPDIALLTPLSMSIWQDRSGNMNISSLTLRGMSRITGIPMKNTDLAALAAKMEKALRKALPGGHFKKTSPGQVIDMKEQLAVHFETEFDVEADGDILDAKDDFEAEFEGEMESIGFLFPGFIDLNDELIDRGNESFDFFDTYSVCKLDVIYPIHQRHPEVGAFAPCTFYLYRKKGDKTVHMGFPAVRNWIDSADIRDRSSLTPLLEAERLFVDTVNDIIH